MVTLPLSTFIFAVVSGWIPFYILARLVEIFIRRFVKPRN